MSKTRLKQLRDNITNPLYMEIAINKIGSAVAEKFGKLEKPTELRKTA
jgi:hypothetical protein